MYTVPRDRMIGTLRSWLHTHGREHHMGFSVAAALVWAESAPDCVVLTPPLSHHEAYLYAKKVVGWSETKHKDDTVLEEARRLTDGPRQEENGDIKDSMTQVAEVWSGQLRRKLRPGVSLDPKDVPLMMAGFKLVRETYKHSRGHLGDAAGYVRLASIVAGDEDTNKEQDTE